MKKITAILLALALVLALGACGSTNGAAPAAKDKPVLTDEMKATLESYLETTELPFSREETAEDGTTTVLTADFCDEGFFIKAEYTGEVYYTVIGKDGKQIRENYEYESGDKSEGTYNYTDDGYSIYTEYTYADGTKDYEESFYLTDSDYSYKRLRYDENKEIISESLTEKSEDGGFVMTNNRYADGKLTGIDVSWHDSEWNLLRGMREDAYGHYEYDYVLTEEGWYESIDTVSEIFDPVNPDYYIPPFDPTELEGYTNYNEDGSIHDVWEFEIIDGGYIQRNIYYINDEPVYTMENAYSNDQDLQWEKESCVYGLIEESTYEMTEDGYYISSHEDVSIKDPQPGNYVEITDIYSGDVLLSQNYESDEEGNVVVTVTDQPGSEYWYSTAYTFSPEGELIAKHTTNSDGYESDSVYADGCEIQKYGDETYSYETWYDLETGNEIKQLSFENGKLTYECRNEYDENNNIIRRDDFDGNGKIIYSYIYEYNEEGMQMSESVYDGKEQLQWKTENEYNDAGILVKQNSYDRNGKLSTYTEYEYNDDGMDLGNKIYDANGKLLTEYVMEYDANGNMIRTANYNNGELYDETIWEYDEDGNYLSCHYYLEGELQW